MPRKRSPSSFNAEPDVKEFLESLPNASDFLNDLVRRSIAHKKTPRGVVKEYKRKQKALIKQANELGDVIRQIEKDYNLDDTEISEEVFQEVKVEELLLLATKEQI